MTMKTWVGLVLFGIALTVGGTGYRRRNRSIVLCGQTIAWLSVAVGGDSILRWTGAVLAVWTGVDAWRATSGLGNRNTAPN